jgi:hypothetical protein
MSGDLRSRMTQSGRRSAKARRPQVGKGQEAALAGFSDFDGEAAYLPTTPVRERGGVLICVDAKADRSFGDRHDASDLMRF